MAHQIHEHDNLILTSQPAWHGLGHVFTEAPSLDEAVKIAFPWEPVSIPVVGVHPTRLTEEGKNVLLSFPDNKIIGRVLDNGDFIKFAVVGKDYEVLHNVDLFKAFQPLIDGGLGTIESAGSFYNGRKCFVTVKMAGELSVRGEQIDKYALLSNGHDGLTRAKVILTPVRVVCNNTLTMASTEDGDNQIISVKHTRNIKSNIDRLVSMIDVYNAQFKATEEQLRMLDTKEINEAQLKRYVKVVFSVASLERAFQEADSAQPLLNKDGSERRNKIFEQISNLFQYGVGNQGRTLWDAYNAITEHTTWHRGQAKTTQEDRTFEQTYGNGKLLTDRALQAGLMMVAGK